ncbi:MAG: hypothetical protein KJP02_09150 [Octadecabacter sp.]|nr:hypothetical protein [Octadecabacter sp.]
MGRGSIRIVVASVDGAHERAPSEVSPAGFANPCCNGYTCFMTTRLALVLALLIAAFFVLDHFALHWNAGLFLGKKMLELINYLAFWR